MPARVFVALLSVLSLSCATRVSSSSDEGLALLRKLQEAVGGADRLASVRDYEETVLGETWDQQGTRMEVRKRVRWVRPNHIRIDQVGPGNTYVLYYDGTGGWEIMPDGRLLDLEGGELRFARGYLRGFFLTQLLADRDAAYAVSSPAPNVVRITDQENDGNATDLTLDPTTGLALKEAGVSLADPNRPTTTETLYADWVTVDGIKFRRRFSKIHAGVHVADATVEGIRINTGLDPAVLSRKPPDGKPVMERERR